MKVRFSVALAAALILGLPVVIPSGLQAQTPSVTVEPRPPRISPSVSEVGKLFQSGVDESVIQAYIDTFAQPFNLTVDDILYMEDQGISDVIVTAMLNHDSRLIALQARAEPPPPGDAADDSVENWEALATQPTYVENPPEEVATFYQDLAPYGSWIYLEGQGWCWQPNAAAADTTWQPYLDDGRWLSSDAGWYWDSSYAWGWAPFHYGRWWNAPCGWVWFPDTVWAPSWCTWRSSDRFCGWSPLGPSFFPGSFGLGFRHFGFDSHFKADRDSFAFVNFGNVFDRNLRPHRLGPSEVHGFFDHTVPVGNFVARGNIVINQGVPVSRVAQISGKTIPTVAISNIRVDPKTARPGLQKASGRDVIALPKLTTPTHFNGMVAQRVDPTRPTGAVASFGNGGTIVRDPAGTPAPAPFRGPEVFPWHGGSPGRRGSAPQEFGAPEEGPNELPSGVRQGFPAGPTPRIPGTPPSIPPSPTMPAQGPTPSIPGSPSFSGQNPSFRPGANSFNGGQSGGGHAAGGTGGHGGGGQR